MEKHDEGVILVVGVDTRSKSQVAEALADAVGAWKSQTTERGFRNFMRESEVVVADTVPFRKQYLGEHIFREVKRWIVGNSLRRLLGKKVCVVCVISGADALIAEESISTEANFYFHVYSWLQFLGDFIFPEHRRSIIFVAVNGDDKFDDAEALTDMRRMRNFIEEHKFLTNNVIHADLRDKDSFSGVVNSAIENIFRLENSKEREIDVTCPQKIFHLRQAPLNARNINRLGPWIPERVILFGRSGSGKSTLAQMLTLGRLDLNSEFKASSGIRGETTRVHHGEGRGWYVVDTPGFGEEKEGSITSEEAERKLNRYVRMIGGIYTHYMYVLKKGRIDKLEDNLWRFFVALFGDSIKDHFTVVVSGADKNWLAENIDHLRKCFLGCESFLSADFPKIKEQDEEMEEEDREIREESLKVLERGLASLQRLDMWCHSGEWSKMTELDGVSEAVFDMRAMFGVQRVVNLAKIGAYRVSTGLHRLSILMSEDGCALLPRLDSLDD